MPPPYPGEVEALLRCLGDIGVSHSHIQAVQQGLELLQAQGLALPVALEQILQEGGCGHCGAVPARPDPRAGEEEEAEKQEQAAAPGAHAGDHGASGMLGEKPHCCWIWHSQPSNHSSNRGSSTPLIYPQGKREQRWKRTDPERIQHFSTILPCKIIPLPRPPPP